MKILVAVLLVLLAVTSFFLVADPELQTSDYRRGYNEAINDVEKILIAQLKSDTTVTELVFINPDTVTYYLKPKDR